MASNHHRLMYGDVTLTFNTNLQFLQRVRVKAEERKVWQLLKEYNQEAGEELQYIGGLVLPHHSSPLDRVMEDLIQEVAAERTW